MMQAVEEREALLRLFFQFFSLGHSELAHCLIRRLYSRDAETCRQLLQHVVSLSGLPFDFTELDSHQLSRIQCFLTRPLANSEQLLERLLVLRAELCALTDSLLQLDSESEAGGYLNRNDVSLVREVVELLCERLMPLSRPTRRRSLDGSSTQSALGRVARGHPAVLAAFAAAIQSCPFPSPFPKELEHFLLTIERSCLIAMDGAVRSGRPREAHCIVTCLQGGLLAESEYEHAMRLLVQHNPLSVLPTHVAQAVLSSSCPLLSTTLQKEIDDVLLSSDEVLSFKELFFPAQAPAWPSFGFQEARVHNWHIEGRRLEMVLKDIGRSKFDVLKNWTPGNRRMLSLALLMGWDMLSAQNTSSTFPLKKHLLESVFPRVAAGKQAEFSGAVASLYAKLQFSELLSESLEGSPSACDAASVLTRLQGATPQMILSQSIQHLDASFLQVLSARISPIALSEDFPVVRDLQMILSAGVISCVLAFLTVTADMFNGHGQIPGQSLWLSELSDVVSSIHACLCAMQGTYQHAWLLSTVHFVIQMFLSQSDVFKTLDVIFAPKAEKKRSSTSGSNSSLEPLKLLRDLINVLQDSARQFPFDSSSWSIEASHAHHSVFGDFYNNLQLGMDVLLRPDAKNLWKFLNKGNWRELGGFLSLPLKLHQLLMSQTLEFEADAQNITQWSEWFSQQESISEQPIKTERLPTCLDVIASKRLDFETSQKLLRWAIHCLNASHLASETQEDFLKQRTLDVCQKLSFILEAIGTPECPEQSVAEFFSHGVPSKTTQLSSTSNAANVRRVHEHFKAITRLRDALRDVRRGQLRYLSGLLHNLSRALFEDLSRVDGGALLEIAGYGSDLNADVETDEGTSSSAVGSYVSLMVHYLAEVGDIISTMDDGPTEGHNYFAMLHQSPQELLTNMVGNAQCANDIDHALGVAGVLGVDLAHEVLTTWLSPLYPSSDSDCCPSPVMDEDRRMPTLEALKEMISVAPVRVLIACAFAFLQQKRQEPESPLAETADQSTKTNIYEGRKPESVINCLAAAFGAREEGKYPVLENWITAQQSQLQTKGEHSNIPASDNGDVRAQISKLLEDGSGLREAFKLANTVYDSEPPDEILCEIVTATLRFPQDDEPDGFFFADPDNKDPDPLNSLPVSWVACLKIKDRSRALETAALRVHSWTLDRAIEFYSLQDCPEAAEYLKKLKLYQRILNSPLSGEFHDWTDIDALYERDCGQLARKLLTGGAIGYALEVVQSNDIARGLKCDVYVAHVQSLGRGAASTGSGPIAALRFLKSLPLMDAFDTGMQVLTSCCPLTLSRMLVQYLMSLKQHLPADSVQHLEQTRLGIAALRCLPQQWAEKCARLVEAPSIIVESLIMAQQTVSLKKMMEEVPSLRDDNLLISYARKALGMGVEVEATSSLVETLSDNPAGSQKPESSQAPLQPMLAQRKTSSISESQPGGVGLMPMTVLSGDPYQDEQLRGRHSFRGVPNLTLFRVLLDLLSSSEASALAANRIATDLADARLSRSFEGLEWNAIVAQDFQQSVDVCLEVLSYAEAKSQSPKTADDMQTETSSETSKNTVDDNIMKMPLASAAGPSKMKGEVALRVEVELLQKILMAGIQVSLLDLRDQLRCETLLHRLVTAEQYDLSVQTAKQCSMDERPYWEAWVIACIQEGNFLSAREHVPYVFCIPCGLQMDSSRMRMEARQAAIRLVRVLETTCPIDMPAFFTLHNSLKHSRLGTMFRSSAKELVRLLTGGAVPEMDPFMYPESVGFHEGMKRRDMITVAASSTLMEDRVQFCEELLAAYAPSLLIPFMFRHARGNIACQVMYPVGMEDEGGGPSARSHRRRERAASDRAGSGRASSMREFRGGSSVSSVPSEMASESDVPSPRTVPPQQSSPLLHHRSKSLTTVTTEAPAFQKQIGNWIYARQQSLPGNYGSTFASRNLPPLGQRFSKSDYLINGVDPYVLARDVENVEQICDLSVRYVTVDDMITAMQAGGPRGRRALTEACTWLENQGHYRHLYCCQKALNRLDAAGKTCIHLSWKSTDAKAAIKLLEAAKMHFQGALSVVQRHREVIDDMPVAMTQAELSTLIARTTLQLLIYRELLLKPDLTEGWSPAECTMFTATTEVTPEDTARRMRIVQRLLLRDFTLGFRVIFEFRLSETEAYSNTVAAMALERKHKAILDLVNNIKGTVSDQQLDHILFHAVSAYVARNGQPENEEWTHWFAEGLIELMVSPHCKVRAFLKLRNIDAAYKLAQLHGAQGDLSIVMEAAERHGHRSIVRNCERILGRAHIRAAT